MAKLLLVEDDNNLREIYEARLQAEGYTIVSAKDGEEALVVAKAELPDLIISDVMMPKISGFEMLDILRNTEDLKNVKVIMLTALGQSDDQQRADRLGADRYLVKSQVTLEDIVKVAHELLGDQAATPAAPAPEPAAPAAPTTTPPVSTIPEPAPAPEPTAAPEPVAAPATPPVSTVPDPAAPEPVTPTQAALPPAPGPTPTAPESPTESASIESPVSETETAEEAMAEAASQENAESTTEEEADVNAQIESFVAGASSEPAQPDASAAPTTEEKPEGFVATTLPEPVVDPSIEIKDPVDSAADDKLLEEAVKSFEASASKESDVSSQAATIMPDAVAAPAENTQSSIITPEPTPAQKAMDEPKPEEDKPDTGSVPIANKKVIEPIQTGPKADINELLAVEEANEEATKPAPPPVAIIAADGTGPQNVPITENTDALTPKISTATSGSAPKAETDQATADDPNSIAL